MDFLRRSFGITQFQTLGDWDSITFPDLNKACQKQMARAVNVEVPIRREIESGWVVPRFNKSEELDLLDEERFDLSYCLAENGLILRSRIERRRVHSNLLKLMWKEEQKNHAGTKLSREQKLDLYAQLKQTLLNRALPSVEYVDALWEVDNRMLYLFSTSKAQIDEFTGLFQRTFYQLVGSKKNDALLKMASPLYSGAERLIKGNSELASSFFSQLSSIVPETWVSEDNNF